MSATGVVEPHLGQKRETLLARLAEARANTDRLFELVRPEALYDRPIPERHRLIFYVGHLEAFDWNLIATGTLGVAASRPSLDNLFAFGIDPVGGNLPSDQPSDWPSLAQVRAYSHATRQELDRHLSAFDNTQLLQVAIEH